MEDGERDGNVLMNKTNPYDGANHLFASAVGAKNLYASAAGGGGDRANIALGRQTHPFKTTLRHLGPTTPPPRRATCCAKQSKIL